MGHYVLRYQQVGVNGYEWVDCPSADSEYNRHTSKTSGHKRFLVA